MKNIIALSMIFLLLTLTSCEAVGDIFSAGVYTGIFIVILVIVVIVWLISRMGKRG